MCTELAPAERGINPSAISATTSFEARIAISESQTEAPTEQ